MKHDFFLQNIISPNAVKASFIGRKQDSYFLSICLSNLKNGLKANEICFPMKKNIDLLQLKQFSIMITYLPQSEENIFILSFLFVNKKTHPSTLFSFNISFILHICIVLLIRIILSTPPSKSSLRFSLKLSLMLSVV